MVGGDRTPEPPSRRRQGRDRQPRRIAARDPRKARTFDGTVTLPVDACPDAPRPAESLPGRSGRRRCATLFTRLTFELKWDCQWLAEIRGTIAICCAHPGGQFGYGSTDDDVILNRAAVQFADPDPRVARNQPRSCCGSKYSSSKRSAHANTLSVDLTMIAPTAV